jgi:mannose-6-phosphate isomerase-like protein (cupin superfamily)
VAASQTGILDRVSGAVLVPPGGGEIVGDSPERRVEILCDHETLNATWSRFGPRREGADLHVHRQHTDLFYVLAGELTVRLGVEDEPVVVPSGTLARVPPLVVHGFRNGSDAELRYLNFHAPGSQFADYLRALRDGRAFQYDQHPPPSDGGRSPTGAVVGGEEVLADGQGLRVALLADVDAIGIAETRSDPDGAAAPPHVHSRHTESFFVLEGQLTITAAGRELRAEAGSWAQVPPGVPHAFSLSGSGPVRFLEIHTPSRGFGAFLRGLHAARSGYELTAARAAFDQLPA